MVPQYLVFSNSDPTRGVPPPQYYSTFLFNETDPFQNHETPHEAIKLLPPEDVWHPLHKNAPHITGYPQVVLPVPKTDSRATTFYYPHTWPYESGMLRVKCLFVCLFVCLLACLFFFVFFLCIFFW